MAEDHQRAGDEERQQGDGDQQIGADAASPEGPAVRGQLVGAAQSFHQLGDDARSPGDADEAGHQQHAAGASGVGSIDEIALQYRAYVGGQDVVEEVGQLGTNRGGAG